MSDISDSDKSRRTFFLRAASVLVAFAGTMGVVRKAHAVESCQTLGSPCGEGAGSEGYCVFRNGICEVSHPGGGANYYIFEVYPLEGGGGECCPGIPQYGPVCKFFAGSGPC